MSDRRAVFSTHFLKDLEYWTRTDRRTANRLLRLVRRILKAPFGGIGKPEPLKRELAGLWSRRLTQEHRVVYEVVKYEVRFLQARYHY
ncbi:MAG: Txe/YoeB family addiction module toxin [Acidobacteriota bacterium]|nr:Txe/YoeB family addiction module toxin [Acidobacteriota bacterium]